MSRADSLVVVVKSWAVHCMPGGPSHGPRWSGITLEAADNGRGEVATGRPPRVRTADP